MGNKKERAFIRKELESLAPNLARLKEKDQPVDIPDGYFSQMSAELMQRIRNDSPTTVTGPSGWWDWLGRQLTYAAPRPSFAMVLSGLAILIIGLFLFLDTAPPKENTEITLSDEEISDYINYHIDEFDLGLLIEEEAVKPSQPDNEMEGKDSLPESDLDHFIDEWLDEMELEELL